MTNHRSSPACRQPPALPSNPKKAVAHLRNADSVLAKAIDLVGPFHLPERKADFHMIATSVIGQSISIKAAAAIVARFDEKCGGRDNATAVRVLELGEEKMKALGLTRTKAGAIIGLAELWEEEQWSPEVLRRIPDAELIRRMSAVRGIGPWTVKMVLIFGLRRPDVLPHEDLGFQEGLRRMHGMSERPRKRAEIEALTEKWRPWRTVGVVYAWQFLLAADGVDLSTTGWWR